MGREYTVVLEKTSVDPSVSSGLRDLFEIIGATGRLLEIVSFNIDCVDAASAPTDQQLALRCRFLPATVTSGSGGTSPTPQKVDNGDAAATFTAKACSTTKATTSGTAVTCWEGGCNVKAGAEKYFPHRQIVGPGQSFVIELITAPATTLTLSGTCTVIEKGG